MKRLALNLVATVALAGFWVGSANAATANPCDGCFPAGAGGCSLEACYIDTEDNLVGCEYQCGCETWKTKPDGSGGTVDRSLCDPAAVA